MDDFNPGTLILGVIVLFVVIMIAVATNANRNQELSAFAKHWSGRLRDGGFFGSKRVELDFGGVIARLDFTSGEDAQLTHLTVPLRLPIGRLKLRPQNWGDSVGKFLGMEDIEIGAPDFDEAFIIQGSDPKGIAKLLTPAVRSAIVAVGRLPQGIQNDVHLSLGAGSLRITVGSYLSTEASLSIFVSRCRTLFDLLNPESAQGIEFITAIPAAAQSRLPLEAECQVCGSALKENIVYCAKCQTPHHRDCWQYFGSCSVYGCGQKRFVTFDNR